MQYSTNQFLEILPIEQLSSYDKDECKILISDYLNNPEKNKRLKAKNANQLYFVIDFLIEYINNKERIYKEKMIDTLQANNTINSANENVDKKFIDIINPYSKELLLKEEDNKIKSITSNNKDEEINIINSNAESLNNPNLYVKSFIKKNPMSLNKDLNIGTMKSYK